VFTTKSVYNRLTSGDNGDSFSRIWKAKLPYKIKIFLWLLEQNSIFTKDNMIRRKWVGDPKCYFCTQNETANHLFFDCPVAIVVLGILGLCIGATNVPRNIQSYKLWIKKWVPGGNQAHTFGLAAVCWSIWKGNAEIEFVLTKNPLAVIMRTCSFMSYWSGL